MPEVMEFYRMAGDVDYMLRVVVADMQSYDVFYKKLIGAVPLKNVAAMEKIKPRCRHLALCDGEDQVGTALPRAGARAQIF
jgi:DNA-binding Lrp family transcriptional regulator